MLALPSDTRPAARDPRPTQVADRPPLVIGCGALARELVALTRRAGLPAVDLTCLPASLHNRPERIPGAVRSRIQRARADGYDRIFVAYADCGTGGRLDRVLSEEGVARLAGAHCYEVYAGSAAFAALQDEEPGTFYLTDFLVRNFEGLVVRGLGLDRHPELLPIYFGNYRRLVYLAQTSDPALDAAAHAAADRLGLAFERRSTGFGELGVAIAAVADLDSHARNRGVEADHVTVLAGWADVRPVSLRDRHEPSTFDRPRDGDEATRPGRWAARREILTQRQGSATRRPSRRPTTAEVSV